MLPGDRDKLAIEGPRPRSRIARGRWLMLLCAALMQFALSAAMASSVRAVALDEMLAAAELVFEGRVIGEQTRRGMHKRDIYTEVTFEVIDVVKGYYPGEIIVLEFSGGKLGGETVIVTDLNRPSLGQRGIYFVESLHRRQVHPLYGWDQGLLLIETDLKSGEDQLKTHDRRGIYGVTVQQALESEPTGLSNGTAMGLRLRRSAEDEKPMTPENFKDTLRNILQGMNQ